MTNSTGACEESPRRPAAARIAVVAVSGTGSALALRIAASLPHSAAYVPARFLPETARDPRPPAVLDYDGRVAPVIAALFAGCESLVLVMAAGAAVRLIAPHLRDKESDPAVVVVDDAGRFAISLLGGHAAGANDLAEAIVARIGATPVLTTATEPAGAPAIETIARARRWRREPGPALTALLAALVNGDRVGVFQDAGDRKWLAAVADRMEMFESMESLAASRPAAALIVSDRALTLPATLTGRSAVYRPPVLALGIGCSRGVECSELTALVDATLAREGLSPLAVAGVATIDRRRDEPGLRKVLGARGWPLAVRSAESLAAVRGEWAHSETVKRAVGVGAVAEPAALSLAGVPRLLVRKVKSAHATLAIARSPVELQFEEGESE